MRNALGNFAGSSPGCSTLTMLDPGWAVFWERTVPPEEEVELPLSGVMITEISCMFKQEFNCGDWVEFYNPTGFPIDMGGFILSDSEGNECMVPWNTIIEPEGFSVLTRDPGLFESCYSDCNSSIPGLGFGLDSELDSISVFDRSGRKLLCIAWNMNEYPPPGRIGVLGLVYPSLPDEDPASWELAPFPGTPGEPNRLWGAGGGNLRLTSIYPNPLISGSISFEFVSMTWPVRAFIMDMSGRIIADHGLLDTPSGRQLIEIPENSPAGIYFLVLQSGGNITAKRLTYL